MVPVQRFLARHALLIELAGLSSRVWQGNWAPGGGAGVQYFLPGAVIRSQCRLVVHQVRFRCYI